MGMAGQRIGSQTINGWACEVYASADGRFRIGRDGEELGAGETLEAAVNAARVKIRKGTTKVHVDFISRDNGEKGFAYGVHAGHGSILVEYASGPKDTLRPHDAPFKPDTPKDVIDKYFENKTTIAARQDANKAIEREWTQQIGGRVNDAIEAAQAEAAKPKAKPAPVIKRPAKRPAGRIQFKRKS